MTNTLSIIITNVAEGQFKFHAYFVFINLVPYLVFSVPIFRVESHWHFTLKAGDEQPV